MNRFFKTALACIASLSFTTSEASKIHNKALFNSCNTWNEVGFTIGGHWEQLNSYPIVSDYSMSPSAGIYYKRRKDSKAWIIGLNAYQANYTTEYSASHQFGTADTRDTAKKGDFKITTVSVPILFELRPQKHFGFQFGISANYNLMADDNNGALTKYYGDANVIKPLNVFGVVGFEFDILQGVRLAGNMGMGLLDVNNNKFVQFKDKWLMTNGNLSLIVRLKKIYPKHF